MDYCASYFATPPHKIGVSQEVVIQHAIFTVVHMVLLTMYFMTLHCRQTKRSPICALCNEEPTCASIDNEIFGNTKTMFTPKRCSQQTNVLGEDSC